MSDELTVNHYPTATDLLASARHCFICRAVSGLIPQEVPGRSLFVGDRAGWTAKLASSRPRPTTTQSRLMCLRLEFWDKREESVSTEYNPKVTVAICGDTDPRADRSMWRDRAVLFPDRLKVVQTWLQRCDQEHRQCAPSGSRLPARFVDLGGAVTSDSVKIVRSDEVSANALTYVALSHCWGPPSSQPFKTTKANRDANSQGVALGLLPRTFQDAIRVCRALGTRYLWIDSLCIVQDDAADWEAEAANMADVYQGAWFSIAATSSGDGSGGLFLDSISPAYRVALDVDPERTCFVRYPIALESAIVNAPLSQRAWVLQEQILSSRLIHFTKNQMYYQCRVGLESEDGILNETQFTSIRGTLWYVHRRASSLGTRAIDLRDEILAMDSWWSWVAEYCSRSLTFHKDRMAAFAGITEYYRAGTSHTSILGLWEKTLWFDLAWRVDMEGRYRRPTTNDQELRLEGIPTWSWLSLRPSVAVTPILTLRTKRPFDYYNKAELVAWEAHWGGDPYTSNLVDSKLVVRGIAMEQGFALPPSHGKEPRRPSFTAEWDEFLDVQLELDAEIDESQRSDVVLLLLFADPIYESFLAVRMEQSATGSAGYRRLGVGRVHRPRGRDGFFKDGKQAVFTLI